MYLRLPPNINCVSTTKKILMYATITMAKITDTIFILWSVSPVGKVPIGMNFFSQVEVYTESS